MTGGNRTYSYFSCFNHCFKCFPATHAHAYERVHETDVLEFEKLLAHESDTPYISTLKNKQTLNSSWFMNDSDGSRDYEDFLADQNSRSQAQLMSTEQIKNICQARPCGIY